MEEASRLLAVGLLALALSGCGGGGGGDRVPSPLPPSGTGDLTLPPNHALIAGDIIIEPFSSAEHGNVVFACPAGGRACLVSVAADGSATYDQTGGIPTVMVAYEPWGLPSNHRLAAGRLTVRPGASDEHGNVVVSCPAGGNACVVNVAADGSATYDQTGGIPTVMVAYEPWDLPSNHGLAAGRLTVPPGASDEHGNVVVSCPAGGNACVVNVETDGSATYDQTGGIPTVMVAYEPWDLPLNHGLAAGRLTVRPSASDEHGNVVVSCPVSGKACVVNVAADGSATYDQTGGIPTVMVAYEPWGLPSNHRLAAGRLTVRPGASDEHGNVVVSCPAGGNACVVNVAADGSATYDQTGGIPTVMVAYEPWDLPSNHGLAAGRLTVPPGASDEHGNVVVSCPAGGNACVVNVAADGSATYDQTGGIPTVMLARPEEFPALPAQRAVDALQAPIVHLGNTLHVGADVAPSAGQLVAVGTHSGITVSYGRIQDGAGADEVITYLNQRTALGNESPGFSTFSDQPVVRLTEAASDELTDYALRAIQLINAALPHEKRILFSSAPAPPRMPLQIPWGDVPRGGIFVDLSSPENPGHPPGTAYSQSQGVRQISSYVLINPAETINAIELADSRLREQVDQFIEDYEDYLSEQDFSEEHRSRLREQREEQLTEWYGSELERQKDRYKNVTLYVLVHEFIHAIGMNGHSDSTRFPNSVMHAEYSGQTQEHILGPIDREVLLASYSVLEPGASAEQIAEDLGPWDDTSVHIRGELDIQGEPVSFGVALRNGLAQPWASGPTPWTNLADNPTLSETVSWSGRLLGFTPVLEAVGGAANLAVVLETLDGQLDFTNMEYWSANAVPGPVGSGMIWGDSDLRYLLNIRGNSFAQTGGDDGTVTGAFFGPAHEAMGGVLERTDLVAGFGGTR